MGSRVQPLWPTLLLVLGLIGFADATYLSFKKLSGEILPCVITSSCEVVTNSRYATIGPVPISILGAGYYMVIIVLSIMVMETQNPIWLARLGKFTWIGFLFSLYLLFVMALILKSYCFFCLISAGTSIMLWIVGQLARRGLRISAERTPAQP